MAVPLLVLFSIILIQAAAEDATITYPEEGGRLKDPTYPICKRKTTKEASCPISDRNDLFRKCCAADPEIAANADCLATCSYTDAEGGSLQQYIGDILTRCGSKLLPKVFACSTDDPEKSLACCKGDLRLAEEENLRQPMSAKFVYGDGTQKEISCFPLCAGSYTGLENEYAQLFPKMRSQPCYDLKTDIKSCLREFKYCDKANPPVECGCEENTGCEEANVLSGWYPEEWKKANTNEESAPVATDKEPESVPPATDKEPESVPPATDKEPESVPPATDKEPESVPPATDKEPESVPPATDKEPESVPPATDKEPESVPPATDKEPESVPPATDKEPESVPPATDKEPESVPPATDKEPESVPPATDKEPESVPPATDKEPESVPPATDKEPESVPPATDKQPESVPPQTDKDILIVPAPMPPETDKLPAPGEIICTTPEEIVNPCGQLCEPKCSDPNTICIKVCIAPACVCKDGLLRDSSGKCVEKSQCKTSELTCPANEVVNSCGNLCEATCKNPANMICPAICNQPACECMKGYARSSTGKCVPVSECKSELKCPANEVVNSCGNQCEVTCQNPANLVCPAICNSPACECMKGYARNGDGKCVPVSECTTPSTECQKAVAKALLLGARPGLYVPNCTPEGHYTSLQCHGSTGYCWCVDPVTGTEVKGTRSAPGQQQPKCDKSNLCKKNETFFQCDPSCEPTCSNHEPTCPVFFMCPGPACRCSKGYVRNNGKCVLATECTEEDKKKKPPVISPYPGPVVTLPKKDPCEKAVCKFEQKCVPLKRSNSNEWSYKCISKNVCGTKDMKPMKDTKGKFLNCSDCKTDSEHFCATRGNRSVCCAKKEHKGLKIELQAVKKNLKAKKGVKLSEIVKTFSIQSSSKTNFDKVKDVTVPQFAVVSIEPAMDMEDTDLDKDPEAQVAADCHPPSKYSCMLKGGLIDLTNGIAKGSDYKVDGSKISLECENGKPLPEGQATLVVDSDPFRRISKRCSVATIQIEIESSGDTTEKGKDGRGFDSRCSAFGDIESLGLQGYIVNDGKLMMYSPLSKHGPQFKPVRKLGVEVMFHKMNLLKKFYKSKIAENGGKCPIAVNFDLKDEDLAVEKNKKAATDRKPGESNEKDDEKDPMDEAKEILKSLGGKEQDRKNFTQFLDLAEHCAGRKYFSRLYNMSCPYQKALRRLIAKGFTLEQKIGEKSIKAMKEKKLQPKLKSNKKKSSHGVGRFFKDEKENDKKEKQKPEKVKEVDLPKDLTPEDLCITAMMRKFFIDYQSKHSILSLKHLKKNNRKRKSQNPSNLKQKPEIEFRRSSRSKRMAERQGPPPGVNPMPNFKVTANGQGPNMNRMGHFKQNSNAKRPNIGVTNRRWSNMNQRNKYKYKPKKPSCNKKDIGKLINGKGKPCNDQLPMLFWAEHNGAIFQGFKTTKGFKWQKRAVCSCKSCHADKKRGGHDTSWIMRNKHGYRGNYQGGNQERYQGGHKNKYQGGYHGNYQGGNQERYQGGHENKYQGGYHGNYQGGNQGRYQGGHQNKYQGGNWNKYQGGNWNKYQGGNQRNNQAGRCQVDKLGKCSAALFKQLGYKGDTGNFKKFEKFLKKKYYSENFGKLCEALSAAHKCFGGCVTVENLKKVHLDDHTAHAYVFWAHQFKHECGPGRKMIEKHGECIDKSARKGEKPFEECGEKFEQKTKKDSDNFCSFAKEFHQCLSDPFNACGTEAKNVMCRSFKAGFDSIFHCPLLSCGTTKGNTKQSGPQRKEIPRNPQSTGRQRKQKQKNRRPRKNHPRSTHDIDDDFDDDEDDMEKVTIGMKKLNLTMKDIQSARTYRTKMIKKISDKLSKTDVVDDEVKNNMNVVLAKGDWMQKNCDMVIKEAKELLQCEDIKKGETKEEVKIRESLKNVIETATKMKRNTENVNKKIKETFKKIPDRGQKVDQKLKETTKTMVVEIEKDDNILPDTELSKLGTDLTVVLKEYNPIGCLMPMPVNFKPELQPFCELVNDYQNMKNMAEKVKEKKSKRLQMLKEVSDKVGKSEVAELDVVRKMDEIKKEENETKQMVAEISKRAKAMFTSKLLLQSSSGEMTKLRNGLKQVSEVGVKLKQAVEASDAGINRAKMTIDKMHKERQKLDAGSKQKVKNMLTEVEQSEGKAPDEELFTRLREIKYPFEIEMSARREQCNNENDEKLDQWASEMFDKEELLDEDDDGFDYSGFGEEGTDEWSSGSGEFYGSGDGNWMRPKQYSGSEEGYYGSGHYGSSDMNSGSGHYGSSDMNSGSGHYGSGEMNSGSGHYGSSDMNSGYGDYGFGKMNSGYGDYVSGDIYSGSGYYGSGDMYSGSGPHGSGDMYSGSGHSGSDFGEIFTGLPRYSGSDFDFKFPGSGYSGSGSNNMFPGSGYASGFGDIFAGSSGHSGSGGTAGTKPGHSQQSTKDAITKMKESYASHSGPSVRHQISTAGKSRNLNRGQKTVSSMFSRMNRHAGGSPI